MFLIQLNMDMFIKIFFATYIFYKIYVLYSLYIVFTKIFKNLINFYVYCILLELFNITLRHYVLTKYYYKLF